ncbi:iron(III) transport system ATP-binding protein [Rhodobacter aestuarii]|uniref:Iron(III) transport system ATP-binding protein n=1 Tax=Rhodobacter aestuarii TaxID=453582 RepID=A0A1N7IZG8_9RHOB|nr:ABC transporter ATP-binding protein [Rhodobacter aestuarii]PTV97360.1 iron(III) transport system ATP-binding protein [Rhodobacter aestuarii]SIS42371.1 iron(III) transport system ATP-binding protein [Rhodobacter aestuarii]
MTERAAPPPPPWLSIEGVSRRFDGVAALKDISFALGAGEILCLLGASGCGKSTLLRLIAGVERPETGAITLAGQVLSGSGAFVEPEARGIGFMFQDYALFPHLNVADNVAFGLKGRPRAEVQARVNEVLTVAGVAHLADRFPHMLSGGESQRVALARALAPRPRLLLMDEPFSNLDQGLRETVRAETLALLRQMQVGAIIVTHDPSEALAVADRLAVMHAGQIEALDGPRQLYHVPPTLYVAQFLGAGNVVPGVAERGQIATPLGVFPAPDLAQGQPALAFFRPQALTLCDLAEGAAARVLRHDFLGAQERVFLTLEEGGAPLQLDLPATAQFRLHERVGLRLDPAAVRVFAAEG